jgi:hypothetical protein
MEFHRYPLNKLRKRNIHTDRNMYYCVALIHPVQTIDKKRTYLDKQRPFNTGYSSEHLLSVKSRFSSEKYIQCLNGIFDVQHSLHKILEMDRISRHFYPIHASTIWWNTCSEFNCKSHDLQHELSYCSLPALHVNER